MRKLKKAYKPLLIILIVIYFLFTLINQQKTLNQYNNTNKELAKQVDEQKQYKEELAKRKEDVNSLEFIRETAREKLDMYLPNEKVYVDQGM